MLAEKTIVASSILTVAQLSNQLKHLVEKTFQRVQVRGEILGLKKHISGHCYFTLKDETAVLDGVCWRGVAAKLPIPLEDGLEVVASGRLTTYAARSKYQLVVDHVSPFGQGALLKLLQERKQRLTEEGLFASERKRPLPHLPRTIGVVTSATGAVIQDILHRLRDRFPCRVVVWPVLVQGNDAADQIATAICGFNANNTPIRPDVLIIARGGGSLEDLWAFNEESVVRAVAASEIPIISAVGHETDVTLIDFVSDKRAPTPTAAAEMAVPVLSDLWETIQVESQRCRHAAAQTLVRHQLTFQALSVRLIHPRTVLEDRIQRLDDLTQYLDLHMRRFFDQKTLAYTGLAGLVRAPHDAIRLSHQSCKSLAQQLGHFFQVKERHLSQAFQILANRLEHLSYTQTLKRGFCLASTPNGALLNCVQDAAAQSVVQLQFQDGTCLLKTNKG